MYLPTYLPTLSIGLIGTPFCSNDPSSNPAEVYTFSVKMLFEKNENKQNEDTVGYILFYKNIDLKVFIDIPL